MESISSRTRAQWQSFEIIFTDVLFAEKDRNSELKSSTHIRPAR